MRTSLVMNTLLIFFTALCATACSTRVYAPARSANFNLDAEFEINDEDIRKAFDARPQLPEKLKIAYYSFDPDKTEDIESLLQTLPGVTDVYAIPSLMVTGERRIEERAGHHYYEPPRQPMSVKKLRLLAARAHCDLLLVFDHAWAVREVPNGLVALDVLLFPVLFLPQTDIEVESYLDTYAIDVRNGYLYAHVASSEEDEEEYETIWSEMGETFLERQWEDHMQNTGAYLERVIEDSITFASTEPASAEGAEEPAEEP